MACTVSPSVNWFTVDPGGLSVQLAVVIGHVVVFMKLSMSRYMSATSCAIKPATQHTYLNQESRHVAWIVVSG